MSARTKSLLALFGTLTLGIALGAVLTIAVIRNRAATFTIMMIREERFVNRLEHLIQPSPQQADTVRAVLHKYGHLITSRAQTFRTEQWRTFDSLKSELQPILSSQQYERILQAAAKIDKRR